MASIKILSINPALVIAKYDRHLTSAVLKEYNINTILHIAGDSRDSHSIHRALGGCVPYSLEDRCGLKYNYLNISNKIGSIDRVTMRDETVYYAYNMLNYERTAIDMLEILQHTISIIDAIIDSNSAKNKRVLICCNTGRDCAPFIAAAYTIWQLYKNGEKICINSLINRLEQDWTDTAINCAFVRMLSWFSASLARLEISSATPAQAVSELLMHAPYIEFLRQQGKMTYVLQGLYLSSLVASETPMALWNNKIRAVIRIRTPDHADMPARYRSPDYQNRPYNVLGRDSIREHVIDLYDSSDPNEANLLSYVRYVNHLIDMYRQKKHNVLVHCDEGISRSVAFIIAYLIDLKWREGIVKITHNVQSIKDLPIDYAHDMLAHIRVLRPMANPNPGFMAQLKYYCESHNYIYPAKREGRLSVFRTENVARFFPAENTKYVPQPEPDNTTSDDDEQEEKQ